MSCLEHGYSVAYPSGGKGPCENVDCEVDGCKSAHAIAAFPCAECGKPLGYSNHLRFSVDEVRMAARPRLDIGAPFGFLPVPLDRFAFLRVAHENCAAAH